MAEEGKRKEKIIQEKNDDILIHRTEILALTEEGERKDGIILQKENHISSLRIEVQDKKEQNATQMDRLKFSHSTEVEQLQLQIRDMKTQNQYTKAENESSNKFGRIFSVFPSIPKPCRPNKPSVQNLLWCGNRDNLCALLWSQTPPKLCPSVLPWILLGENTDIMIYSAAKSIGTHKFWPQLL